MPSFFLILIPLSHSSAYTNNYCSIDFNNLFKPQLFSLSNVSSHKSDWILSESSLLALFCLLYRRLNSVMKRPEGKCLCLCEICRNVNRLLAMLLLLPFFILMLLLFFAYSLIMQTRTLFFSLEHLFIIFHCRNNICVYYKSIVETNFKMLINVKRIIQNTARNMV